MRPSSTPAAISASWRAASATAPRRPRAAIWASSSAAQLAKVLEDKTFALKTGEYTEPIRTRQGYVILKVVQHVPGGVPPLKDVEQQVEQNFFMSGWSRPCATI